MLVLLVTWCLLHWCGRHWGTIGHHVLIIEYERESESLCVRVCPPCLSVVLMWPLSPFSTDPCVGVLREKKLRLFLGWTGFNVLIANYTFILMIDVCRSHTLTHLVEVINKWLRFSKLRAHRPWVWLGLDRGEARLPLLWHIFLQMFVYEMKMTMRLCHWPTRNGNDFSLHCDLSLFVANLHICMHLDESCRAHTYTHTLVTPRAFVFLPSRFFR